MKLAQLARFASIGAAAAALLVLWAVRSPAKPVETPNAGSLEALDKTGKPLGPCPLKHTDVTVDVAGFIARVTVRQQFHNPFANKIEAIYTFPLSQDAAVDRMTMKVGERVIQGEIKERGEARQIYESAKAAGKVASLLDQERPNIFTQSVANIEPGEQVDITISYSEMLDWTDGAFHFDFPMVVGPRYIPGGGSAPAPMTFGRPTPEVPDADRITPPVTPKGTRAGHDISVTVHLDAGLPIRRLDSKQHEVDVEHPSGDKSRAVVRLKQRATIPNKDFVLEYETASDRIEDTLMTHTDPRGKFFSLVLQPPKRVRKALVVPKELVFVIDKSGSMSGFPIDTAKKAMALCIDGLHENDTFNLMTFEGGVGFCFPKPVPNTDENRRLAQAYLASLQGSGGTEMMKAIYACLAGQDDPERVRVVCFMTDGYVGNDMAIIDAVRKHAGTARVFAFGIGTSVNRFLLDGMAHAGRGEVHYILSPEQAGGAAERFYERVRMPVLTDIQLDFGNLQIEEVYPRSIPDLFAAKPVVVKGRYKQGGAGTITLRGKTGEGPFERSIEVRLPDDQAPNDVLAPLWARAKVDHLMDQDLGNMQINRPDPAVKEEILGLGLRYQIMTQFTSFVAVEHKRVTKDGKLETVAVPVDMPEGVSHEGVFGRTGGGQVSGQLGLMQRSMPARPAARGAMGGYGGMGANAPAMMPGAAPGMPATESKRPADAFKAAADAAYEPSASSGEKLKKDRKASDDKLAPELRGLARKVAALGPQAKDVRIGTLRIQNGRLVVRIELTALAREVLDQLKRLGFEELSRSEQGKQLVGRIHVSRLDALAQIAEVLRVEPGSAR